VKISQNSKDWNQSVWWSKSVCSYGLDMLHEMTMTGSNVV